MPRKKSTLFDVPRDQAMAIRVEEIDAARFLHESTSRDAIRKLQRRDVRAYRKLHPKATPAEIGDALDLPAWIVECRMAEMAGEPVPYRNPKIGKMSTAGASPNYIPQAKLRPPPTERQRAAKQRCVLGPVRPTKRFT